MNDSAHSSTAIAVQKPTRVRFGVLALCCILSTITYLDRVCFGTVASNIRDEFGFSEAQRGLLFTAFAFAYAAFEVPTGWLGDLFGDRKTLIRIVLWWSGFTALTGLIYPTWFSGSVSLAFATFFVVRFLFGVGEAGAYPNIARAFHSWFPFDERASAKGAVWMAGRFGGGITGFVALALMYTTVDFDAQLNSPWRHAFWIFGPQFGAVASAPTVVTHWRHIFWIFGVLGVIWCVVFWWWYRDKPAEHPSVNAAERALVVSEENAGTKPLVVPWKKLLTSANLWILCLMYFCAAYGWYFNITYLPGYLRDYYNVTPGPRWSAQFWATGLMVGLPLLVGAVGCLIGGILSDAYIRRTGDRRWGRRLFGVVGHALCALFYFGCLFVDGAWPFVLCVAAASFCNDLTMGASWASCLDIGKRYAGIVAGCMNTVGNLGGAVAGTLSGFILESYRKPAADAGADGAALFDAMRPGWTINLVSYASVYIAATLLWLLFDPKKPVSDDA